MTIGTSLFYLQTCGARAGAERASGPRARAGPHSRYPLSPMACGSRRLHNEQLASSVPSSPHVTHLRCPDLGALLQLGTQGLISAFIYLTSVVLSTKSKKLGKKQLLNRLRKAEKVVTL